MPRLRLIVVVLVALSLAGCGGEREIGLAPLRADPMASVSVPGTETGTTRESGAGRDLGAPTLASLTRRLPVAQGSDPQTVLDSAVDLAEAGGWVDPVAPQTATGAWLFSKQVDGDRLELSLHIDDIDGQPTLVIGLRNLTAVA